MTLWRYSSSAWSTMSGVIVSAFAGTSNVGTASGLHWAAEGERRAQRMG
jgi:hypothetical protein